MVLSPWMPQDTRFQLLAYGSRSLRWITSWAEKNNIRRSSLCDSERDKFRRKVQKLVMGDSRDEDRADQRSRKIGPLSRKTTTVVAKSHGSERSSCLEKIDLAAIESSSAFTCADALAAIFTFWRSDNTPYSKDEAHSTSRDRAPHRLHEEKNMSAGIHRVSHKCL